MEYLEGFSLQDLVNNIGSITEDILKPIILKIVESLMEYNEKFSADYRDICPCDIVFDKKGNLKVRLKLYIAYSLCSEESIQSRNRWSKQK